MHIWKVYRIFIQFRCSFFSFKSIEQRASGNMSRDFSHLLRLGEINSKEKCQQNLNSKMMEDMYNLYFSSTDHFDMFDAFFFFFSFFSFFLVHLDQRSMGTIAITWHPSSTLFTFQASSPKPLGQLEPNLAGMFLYKVSVFHSSRIFNMAARANNMLWLAEISKILFSETNELTEPKL